MCEHTNLETKYMNVLGEFVNICLDCKETVYTTHLGTLLVK